MKINVTLSLDADIIEDYNRIYGEESVSDSIERYFKLLIFIEHSKKKIREETKKSSGGCSECNTKHENMHQFGKNYRLCTACYNDRELALKYLNLAKKDDIKSMED